MNYKNASLAAIFAAAALCVGASAQAAPVGPLKSTNPIDRTQVQTVDYRGYYHCHRRYGKKWCHGGPSYRRGYGYGPGVSLYIGPRYGWGHRRHGHWGHGHRKWR